MLSTREIILLIAALIVLVCAGYYMLFFIPAQRRMQELDASIEQTRSAIQEAQIRTILYAQLHEVQAANDYILDLFNIPDYFDEADILRRIQRIVYPLVSEIDVVFFENTATIRFSASFAHVISILQDFTDEDFISRVVNYSLSYNAGEWSTTLNLEVLTRE